MTRTRTLRAEEKANKICAGDCCIGAVQRSYSEMCASGAPESIAFDAALTVFRWHHPEVPATDAVTLVRGWIPTPVTARRH